MKSLPQHINESFNSVNEVVAPHNIELSNGKIAKAGEPIEVTEISDSGAKSAGQLRIQVKHKLGTAKLLIDKNEISQYFD